MQETQVILSLDHESKVVTPIKDRMVDVGGGKK